MIPKAYQERVCSVCGYRDPSVYRRNGQEICAECWKRQHGISTTDIHHLYGRTRNETVEIPANLHAYLTDAKMSWPKDLSKYLDEPILQIAYSLRANYDLIQWMIVHLEQRKKNRRRELILESYTKSRQDKRVAQEQVHQMLHKLTYQFEESSNWLIALHLFLVKDYGQDYYQKIGIAPLRIEPHSKDE